MFLFNCAQSGIQNAKSPKKFHEYLPKIDVAGSFNFNPVSYIEIETDIMNIQLSKAHGL